jgi:hypothetical protein
MIVYLGSIYHVRKEAPTASLSALHPLEWFNDTAEKLRAPRDPRGIRASDSSHNAADNVIVYFRPVVGQLPCPKKNILRQGTFEQSVA